MLDSIIASSTLAKNSVVDERLPFILDMMREMSRITDPQALVEAYGARMRQIMPVDGMVALSRRDLESPSYRITRSSKWDKGINPWRDKSRLPVFTSGLLGELLYADEPTVIDDLDLSPDDPAAEYFEGMKSLLAIPLFEHGHAINMVVSMRNIPGGFSRGALPAQVWMGNLFGRATHTLVLSKDVKDAYDAVERELKAVADIQRSLLPTEMPVIDKLELAVHYQTSRHSGGDYYDFFKLPNNQWGFLIADVSGHGTPAAVLMAITHTIAHMVCDPPVSPGALLKAINARLTKTYTMGSGSFVTAFYGVYDVADQTLTWSNAGHPPPRLRMADGTVRSLPLATSLPLGIEADENYEEQTMRLSPGDLLLLYTDGITEARNGTADLFEVERLDGVLRSIPPSAPAAIDHTLLAIDTFSAGFPLTDDRTLVALQVK